MSKTLDLDVEFKRMMRYVEERTLEHRKAGGAAVGSMMFGYEAAESGWMFLNFDTVTERDLNDVGKWDRSLINEQGWSCEQWLDPDVIIQGGQVRKLSSKQVRIGYCLRLALQWCYDDRTFRKITTHQDCKCYVAHVDGAYASIDYLDRRPIEGGSGPMAVINKRIRSLSPEQKIAFWIKELDKLAQRSRTNVEMLAPRIAENAAVALVGLGEAATKPLIDFCGLHVDTSEFEGGARTSRTMASEIVVCLLLEMESARLGAGNAEIEAELKALMNRSVNVNRHSDKWGLIPYFLAAYLHSVFGYPEALRSKNDEVQDVSVYL